jgi:hypothetical protein
VVWFRCDIYPPLHKAQGMHAPAWKELSASVQVTSKPPSKLRSPAEVDGSPNQRVQVATVGAESFAQLACDRARACSTAVHLVRFMTRQLAPFRASKVAAGLKGDVDEAAWLEKKGEHESFS